MTLFDQDDWPEMPLRGRDVAGIAFFVFVASLFAYGITDKVAPPVGMHLAAIVYCGVIAGIIFLVAIANRGASWADLGLRSTSLKWLGLALGLAPLTYLVLWPVEWLLDALGGSDYINPQFEAHLWAVPSWQWWLPEVLFFVAVQPFIEELFFRGVFYGWLRQKASVTAALLGNSLLFALLHPGDLVMFPLAFLLGIAFALVFEVTRSLWPAIITHGAYNALVLIGWHSL